MDAKTIESYKRTVKKMVSLAKTLIKNEIPVIYELGHYLADNVLSKVSMIILAEKNRVDLIFENGESGRTVDFPALYKNMQQNYFPNILEYDDLVKEHHADRSMYQHRFESLKMTIRQPEAEKYVDFVIEVMRKTGILGKNELLPYINLFSGASINLDHKINYRQIKYQNLYNLLKNPHMKDVDIALNNLLDYALVNSLKEDLIMELFKSKYDTTLSNSDWSLSFTRGYMFLRNKASNESFIYAKPEENIHVLKDFLSYFRGKAEEKGIIIKE